MPWKQLRNTADVISYAIHSNESEYQHIRMISLHCNYIDHTHDIMLPALFITICHKLTRTWRVAFGDAPPEGRGRKAAERGQGTGRRKKGTCTRKAVLKRGATNSNTGERQPQQQGRGGERQWGV